MDILNKQIAAGVVADVSVIAGKIVVSLTVDAKPEVDSLMDALAVKLPPSLAPLVAALKAGVDSAME